VAFVGFVCFLVKISLKSENQLMSYGQKSDFQDGGRHHVEFLKISIFGHVTTAFAICTEFHQNRTIFD